MDSRIRGSCLVPFAFFTIFSCVYSANSNGLQLTHTDRRESISSCDVYQGSWVRDQTYPLYDSKACPFIRKEFDCLKYGRQDHRYLQFRWQPSSCDLPRFDGRNFLERLRGKKIMFVGDSVSMNQFESLICLLHAAVPNSNIRHETNNNITSVIFPDHGVSIMLFITHYLVDIVQENGVRVLKLDSIRDGNIWKDMDVLVFNTWLWWYRRGPRQPWDYVQVQDRKPKLKDMDRMAAFRQGLTTWAEWVDSQVDPTKSKVIFQGISPFHYNGREWGEPGVKDCSKETEPLAGSTYPAGSPLALTVLEDVLRTVKKPVHLLNITNLSQLRKDAHPSSHNGFHGMDCTHWCVAGLPDTWNQLLYTALVN